MLQTEVTTRAGTFVFSTARIGVDQVTGQFRRMESGD
jgi:hypothetical protein